MFYYDDMNSKNDINNKEIQDLLETNHSLDLLKLGNLQKAHDSFGLILTKNFNNQIADSGIRCCKYWMPRLEKIKTINDDYKRGKQLFKEWLKFNSFTINVKEINKNVISCIMNYIFSFSLESFLNGTKERNICDFDSSFMIGFSYKQIGDYKNAIKFFETSLKIENRNTNAMTQLADCYALINEDKKAKLLFREAFFIDPLNIDIDLLNSDIIKDLISKMLELEVDKKNILNWLPIYARIFNIFTVFRELIPQEVNSIKREILFLERNDINKIENDIYLKTKLLNHYFWIYDYLIIKNKDKYELSEIDYKIKNISEYIYNIFKSNNKISNNM